MDADRDYFERHPTAKFYQRELFPTEHPHVCHEATDYVTVWNLGPGLRFRQGYTFPVVGGTQ